MGPAMQVGERVHVVGSGAMGFDFTDAYDCHVFLVDGGGELALVDIGAGMGVEAILANVRRLGFSPDAIRYLVLTHGHGDHAGGAGHARTQLDGLTVCASPEVAGWIRAADEQGVSLDAARAAGIYPDEYVLERCDVELELVEDDALEVGDLRLRVVATPGHADGHIALLVDHADTRTLFAGDAVFYGGNILLQNLHDCRLDASIATLRKLRGLDVDVLLPGHLTLALAHGQRHIERANEALDRLLIPNQLVNAW